MLRFISRRIGSIDGSGLRHTAARGLPERAGGVTSRTISLRASPTKQELNMSTMNRPSGMEARIQCRALIGRGTWKGERSIVERLIPL
jgi:hypothetical protein